jgi:hypothetical protein
MENLNIQGSSKTPEVNFFPSEGRLEISGRSIPENTMEFYSPVLQALEKYALAPFSETIFKVQLEYFNTSSSKCLLDIFKKLQQIQAEGKSKIKVLWHYEEDDEDMLEAGEDYKSIVKLAFEMIKV